MFCLSDATPLFTQDHPVRAAWEPAVAPSWEPEPSARRGTSHVVRDEDGWEIPASRYDVMLSYAWGAKTGTGEYTHQCVVKG